MPNDSTSSKTNDQKPTADTIPPIFVDQGDLPPMINSSAPSVPLTTVGSAAPTDDIVSTVMPAITTSGTPKKKFAGGKIIATILGLFLLIGGVGAGVYLTGQNQNVNEKAGSDVGYRHEQKCKTPKGNNGWCWDSSDDVCGNDPGHPVACTPINWTDCVPVTEPCGGQGGGGDETPPVIPTPTAPPFQMCYPVYFCYLNGTVGTTQSSYDLTTTPMRECNVANPNTCENNLSYYMTDTGIPGTGNPTTSNICYKMRADAANDPACKTQPPATPTSIPRIPPTITAQCQNIKAYGETWTLLTDTQLSALKAGNKVNFCVMGVATGSSSDVGPAIGSAFDRAKLTINSVEQPEITTRPNEFGFCQLYTIPTGTQTFNVSAQIHHNTLGWK